MATFTSIGRDIKKIIAKIEPHPPLVGAAYKDTTPAHNLVLRTFCCFSAHTLPTPKCFLHLYKYELTAQFRMEPLSVERAEILEAVFRRQYQVEGLTVSYDWFISRNRYSYSAYTFISWWTSHTDHHGHAHNSVVQCEATIRNGFLRLKYRPQQL